METEDLMNEIQGITHLHNWIKNTLTVLTATSQEDAEETVQHVLQGCPLRLYPLTNDEIWDDIPYALLHCCMKHQIQNSDLICEVLRFSWMILRDFSSIFCRSKRRLRRFEVLSPFLLEHDDGDTQLYFLNHSCARRQEIDGHRFVDTLNDIYGTSPIFEAIYDCNVQNVKILLQYGSNFQLTGFPYTTSSSELDFHSRIERDTVYKQWFQVRSVRKLFTSLRIILNRIQPRKRKQGESEPRPDFCIDKIETFPETRDIFRILNLIFRCIPNLGPEILNNTVYGRSAFIRNRNVLTYSWDTSNMIWDLDKDYWKFLTTLASRGFVPFLLERTSCPAKLKHFCRCIIRRSLNTNWLLPFGIWQLNLPKALKNYLNIEED